MSTNLTIGMPFFSPLLPTRLDRLLDSIHPSNTIDYYQNLGSLAINDFDSFISIRTYQEDAIRYCTNFYYHLVKYVSGRRPPHPLPTFELFDSYEELTCALLAEIYGRYTWKSTVNEMFDYGINGGFEGLIRDITAAQMDKLARIRISRSVDEYLDGSSDHERFTSGPQEYIHKYSYLLPEQFTRNYGATRKLPFEEVLNLHPFLLRNHLRILPNFNL